MTAPDRQLSPDVVAEFSKLDPWVFQFRVNGADYGGRISALSDGRISHFFEFTPKPARILELGSLEGAHTIQLATQAGVREVIAIEGRAANIAKAELVKRLLRISNATFVQANLEETDLTTFGEFDAVFCSGLLYHLPEPWKLLEQLPRVAPRLFLWTHYADDLSANEVRDGLRGKIRIEGGPKDPLSGMSETSFWPTLSSLIKLLTTSGYKTLQIIDNEYGHQNGPAVTITAQVPEAIA